MSEALPAVKELVQKAKSVCGDYNHKRSGCMPVFNGVIASLAELAKFRDDMHQEREILYSVQFVLSFCLHCISPCSGFQGLILRLRPWRHCRTKPHRGQAVEATLSPLLTDSGSEAINPRLF